MVHIIWYTSYGTHHMVHIIWYTSDLHVLPTDIYSFILPWQQDLEKVNVKYKYPGYDSLLHVDVCCHSLTSQFLLSWSLRVEITGSDSANRICD